jgi:putative transposase
MSMVDLPPDKEYKTIRLPYFDYGSARWYFITLCTAGRERLFGIVSDDAMQLNEFGRIVEEEWRRSTDLRPGLLLDEFIIMPDHMHALVGLFSNDPRMLEDRAHSCAALQAHARGSRERETRSLSSFIAQFKASATRRINQQRATPPRPVWQPRFFEHIVREQEKLDLARSYIRENPRRWAERAVK